MKNCSTVLVRKPNLEAFVEASRWYAKSYCPVVYQNVSLLTTAHDWLIRYSRRLVRMPLSISVGRRRRPCDRIFRPR